MKHIPCLFLLILCTRAFGSSYIRCSVQASYEIYKGEGLIERSVGSLIALPVEFGFFDNGVPTTASLSGGHGTISIKAIAKDDEATVLLSGGANGSSAFRTGLTFHPRNGSEQALSQGELAPFNYTSPNGRVVFTKGSVKCLPGVTWDYRPVVAP